MLWAEGNGKFDAALHLLERLEKRVHKLPVSYGAFRALLLLRTGEPQEARIHFQRLERELRELRDCEARYVLHYCRSYLATLAVQPAQADYEARQALSLECAPSMQRVLQLHSVYNETDAELDRELLRALKKN